MKLFYRHSDARKAGCGPVAIQLLAYLLWAAGVHGQTTVQQYRSTRCQITLSGTSTLHPWEMKTQQATVAATFEWGKNQQLVRCRQVSFTMPVAGLSSSIEAMDKNYLNAMEANKYKEVAFSGGPCAVSKDASGKYVMHYPVSFSIHGRQKQDTLHLWGTFSKADSAFSFTGSHRIKMSDFGIAPPTFMQGSVTTGDAFEVHFNTTLQKQPQ